MKAYMVDAFTDKKFHGNRAGVVFDADRMTKPEKQSIASEIGASETAFVSASALADFELEFFTPTTQIDFCGHATIATFFMLATAGRVTVNGATREFTMQTRAGIIPVAISNIKGQVVVTIKQYEPRLATPIETAEEVAFALNIEPSQLDSRYPITLVSTGNWHLMVAVSSREVLDSISYDTSRLSAILSRANAVTAHVFCTAETGLFHARNFGPAVGIPEDAATGSAAGAFGGYLAKKGFLPDGTSELQIIQGEAMNRPSQINVTVRSHSGQVEEIQISGTAVPAFSCDFLCFCEPSPVC